MTSVMVHVGTTLAPTTCEKATLGVKTKARTISQNKPFFMEPPLKSGSSLLSIQAIAKSGRMKFDMAFKLQSSFKPSGYQPQAVEKLVKGLEKKYRYQTLLGVTGSGKTFTMANVIQNQQKPTLIISHNKTLAAQLASEFQDFFPDNAVHYFVSYYDYYQPEAYIPRSDTYIEKETQINEEIDRLRNAATQSLLTRRDVIIVASVSCIYGLGSPEDYEQLSLTIKKGDKIKRDSLLRRLTDLQY